MSRRGGWYVNPSKTSLHDSELEVLRKGVPTPSRIPVSQIVTSVERGLSKVPEEEAIIAHRHICSVLLRARLPPSNLPPPLHNVLNNLKRGDVFILPADKGRATVVLERTEYDAKMLEMLSDVNTYRKLDRDPTPAMER